LSRDAKMGKLDKDSLARGSVVQIGPDMEGLGVATEGQLFEAAMNTRVMAIDLNGDGVPEVVAQGTVGCSATGNCPFWIFQKVAKGYRLLLEAEGQAFTIQKTRTNGFFDVVVSMQGSATQSGLSDYHFKNGHYEETGCYSVEWDVLENGKLRELKEFRITSHRCLNQ
jgi:hypothetical protein